MTTITNNCVNEQRDEQWHNICVIATIDDCSHASSIVMADSHTMASTSDMSFTMLPYFEKAISIALPSFKLATFITLPSFQLITFT
jgi:hypothetical protein